MTVEVVSEAKSHGGRPRIDLRAALNGIIFRLRSGCQWNRLPDRFGDDSSVHRWFQRWCINGVFERIWAVLPFGRRSVPAAPN